MARSCNRWVLFKKLTDFFAKWLCIFILPLAPYESSSSSTSLPHLVGSVFLILAASVGVLVVSHCGFNKAFSLITFRINHLFMLLLAICMSLVKCLYIFFPFLWSYFILSTCLLFIFLIKVFYQVHDLLIFPLSLWLVMSAMYFEEQFPFWRASLVSLLAKNLPTMWETWVRKIPWRRERLPTPVCWPRESHGLYIHRHNWVILTFHLTLPFWRSSIY